MSLTPQERLALATTALLISLGAGVRVIASDGPPAEWTAPADTTTGGLQRLRAEVDRETEARRRAAEPLAPGERIDPNSAAAVELDRLPRVGPALAARIVEHRQANGPFRTLGDLDAVSGIGPALLESLAPHVTLPAGPPTAAAGNRPAAAAQGSGRIDVNRATAAELEALPGIGPALARRIVEWRAEHGRFRSVESLESVPGIGPSLRARLAPHVRVDP